MPKTSLCACHVCRKALGRHLREVCAADELEASYSAIAGVELEASRYDKYTARKHKRPPDGADAADAAETLHEDLPIATTQPLGP